MNYTLGHTETEIGSVIFSMNASIFEIQTPKLTFTVYEDDIKEEEGKFIFTIPNGAVSGFQNVREIEIPAYILERKEEVLREIEAGKNSIGSTETPQGKVYFFLTAEGKIKAKLGEKEETTDTFYTVEGKRVLFLPGLELEFAFLGIPDTMETEFLKAKGERERKNLGLVYAGRSLLTGKDYYRFNCEVSNDTLYRVKGQMEYFEGGDIGSLHGWLTSEPEKVEEYLRIRNRIADRKEEIEKQKKQTVKANEKIIEKMMSC